MTLANVLAAFRAGTLELPAQRPTPVLARSAPADSPSATVRRHAHGVGAFGPHAQRRELAAPRGAARPIEPHPAPEVLATPIALADFDLAARLLADAPTSAGRAARQADAAGWTWLATYGRGRVPGRPQVVSESVALRVRRPGAWPWEVQRAVALWRRTGGAGAWTFERAACWRTLSGRTHGEPEALAAGEFGWLLKTRGAGTTNPRRGARKESRAVAAARARGDLDDVD